MHQLYLNKKEIQYIITTLPTHFIHTLSQHQNVSHRNELKVGLNDTNLLSYYVYLTYPVLILR